jgi:hypothetical protein
MAGLVNWLTRSPWRSFIIIFLLAFAIRGFFLTKVSHEWVLPHNRWEVEAIATSLAERGQFADPYAVPTGATAHLPPILPLILASIWRMFGMGLAAGYAAWLFRIATVAAMYATIPWLADKLGAGKQAGFLAGIAGAFVATWPGHGEALTAALDLRARLTGRFLSAWAGSRHRSSPAAGPSAGGAGLHGLRAVVEQRPQEVDDVGRYGPWYRCRLRSLGMAQLRDLR